MSVKISFLLYFLLSAVQVISQNSYDGSQDNGSSDIVFSPFSIAQFDLTNQFGTAKIIKIAYQENIVAVACGVAGVLLIDGSTNQFKYQKVFEKETIEGLAITQDAKYVMLPHQNKFSIFEYVQNGVNQDLVLISQATYSKGFLQDIILDSAEKIAFAYGTLGTLIAYNITDIYNPQQIGAYFSNSAQVRRAVIANDNSFLYLADDVNGLVLLKIQKIPEFQLIVATTGGSTWWQSWALAITSDKRYAYIMDNWDGIWIADLQNIYDTDEALYPAQIKYSQKFWPYSSPSVYSALITKDNNFLLIGHRSIGVQVIDIRNKISPVQYQTIPSEAVGFDLRLSQDEQKLYYANAKSIIVFQQSIPNFNNYFPNLHNFQQTDIAQFSNTKYQWRCDVSEDDKYFYGYFDDDGLYIMDYSLDPYHMKFQSRIYPNYPGLSIDIAAVLNKKNMYIGAAGSPYVIYNFDLTDPTNPKLIQSIPFVGNTDADGLYISRDKKYLAACNFSCIMLFDLSNPDNIVQLLKWFPPATIVGSIKSVALSQDNKFVIGGVRNWGYFVVDISDFNNPQLVNVVQTSGAEGITVSLDQKYLYCFDGFRGLLILDIQKLPEIKVVSKIQLTGWANYIQPMYNDQYLIVVNFENGQLSLVDIRVIERPVLMSTFDSKRESALGVCTTKNNRFGFIITDKGVRTIPLKSDVTIHSQISRVISQSGSTPQLITLPPNQNLLVGQTIQFNFIIIRPIMRMAIIDVYYYDNYEMKSLPYWMDYTSSSQSLIINVVKEGLGNDYTQPNLNTIIIKSAVPITESSFLYDDKLSGLKTTAQQAYLIYKYLIDQYLLDSNNFVTSFFDHNQPFSFDIPNLNISNMKRLFELVKLTLMRGTYYNPILFYIAPSLTLDLKDLKSPIQTTSTQITFTLLVDQLTGQFVKQTVEGVIVSYADAQNQIKLEGLKDNVNSILIKKLYFALNTNSTNQMVSVTVEDGVNNNIVQTFHIQQLPFIALNIPTTKGIDLQPQVNSYYSGGDVPIDTDLSISFSKESFVDSDSPVLSYTLEVSQGGVFNPVSSDFFLQLSSTDLKVAGKTTDRLYGDSYYLRIKASDGYSEAYNYFQISVNILPFTYVLNLLIKIFGPIIGVLGVYKYKSDILNLIFKEKTFYSTETAQVNSLYRKQITVMGKDLARAYELYLSFKSKMIQKENIFSSEDREKKMYFHQDSVNTIKEEDIEKNKKQNEENFYQTRRLKRIDQDDDVLRKTVFNLQMTPSQRNKQIMKKLYLRKDGSVAMTRMFRDMLQMEITYTLNGKTFFVKNDIKEFQNKDSRFFKCLQGIVARDLIKYDFKASSIYYYLKYYAQKNFQYTANDWYKVYIDVKSTNKKDKYDQQVPFADLQIKEEMINKVFMDLSIHNQKGQKLESIQHLGINSHLIKQNLFSDALGISIDSPSLIKPCVGESLHLDFFQVHSVEAFKEVKNAWCMKLRKFIGMDYMSFGMSKNMTLPHWLKFDMKNGVLILEGIPSHTDIDQLLIRIYDEDLYIVQQFLLNIVDEYNHEKDNVELVDDFNFEENQLTETKLQKDKNMSKASQFKLQNQNSQKLMEQNSQRFMEQDSFLIDRSSTNGQVKSNQSPLLVAKKSNQDYVDELFSIQNKDMITASTTNRQMIDKDVSILSLRNQNELDKTQNEEDASYINLKNQSQNQQKSQDTESINLQF